MHPEFKALLEMVTPEGELIDTINGRVINPGHCIETAWFLLEEAHYRGWDEGKGKEIKEMALQILDWSWEWGWDEEFGGINQLPRLQRLPGTGLLAGHEVLGGRRPRLS